MFYQYLNGMLQGNIVEGKLSGAAIVIDKRHNFISSHFTHNKIHGNTFICLGEDVLIFGKFNNGVPEGINIIDSPTYKMIRRDRDDRIVVVNKIKKKVYVVERKENTEGNGRIGDEYELLFVGRYNDLERKVEQLARKFFMRVKNVEINQFLRKMVGDSKQLQYEEGESQIYLGFAKTKNQNLGMVASSQNTTFSAGLYISPFVKSNRQDITKITNHNIYNSIFFNQIVEIKRIFVNAIKFIDQSMAEEFQDLEQYLDSQKNKTLISSLIIRKNCLIDSKNYGSNKNNVSLEKLNKSLEQLLTIQSQMKNSRSKSKDRVPNPISKSKSLLKFRIQKKLKQLILDQEQTDRSGLLLKDNKVRLKQQLYEYMHNQYQVAPKSKSPSKFEPRYLKSRSTSPVEILKKKVTFK